MKQPQDHVGVPSALGSWEHIAIIGSGPSCLYFLQHLTHAPPLLTHIRGITVFERTAWLGMGMPFNPETTDRFNMSNISSEELPELPQSLAGWLEQQDREAMRSLGMRGSINKRAIYNRLILGRYFKAQFERVVAILEEAGIHITTHVNFTIRDLRDDPSKGRTEVLGDANFCQPFDRIIIATGHAWEDADEPSRGYFTSPWPMAKLLPQEGQHFNFPIGTLGASLSAFDVVASMAHRHGTFVREGRDLRFEPHPGTEGFKLVLHSSEGLLPHLRFDLEELERRIYRHVDRQGILDLRDGDGFLRLDRYFDGVCRPALIEAFRKDRREEMVTRLADPAFGITDFVKEMTKDHEYDDPFGGLRLEMEEARRSVMEHQPIHWKETVDDLIYTLNYHVDWLPAEDHRTLTRTVMPFVMNVVAAMPLGSGRKLLALHDAGKLELVAGRVTVAEDSSEPITRIRVSKDGHEWTEEYRLFVNCAGQQPLEFDNYPFPTLIEQGIVTSAHVRFLKKPDPSERTKYDREKVVITPLGASYRLPGIAVDEAFRPIGKSGAAHPRLHDVAFPHASGVRPYSYGLQACDDAGAIVVQAWLDEISRAMSPRAALMR